MVLSHVIGVRFPLAVPVQNILANFMIKVGIIGGSGLDNPDILVNAKDIEVQTPYGKPSSFLKTGKIGDAEVVLLSRHGREHTIPPSQVNFRANIQALKEIGCTHILATTAVGSLKAEIKRGDMVILDQFIDFTRHRFSSFYESFPPHAPVHASMPDPFSKYLRALLIDSCRELRLSFHKQGTVITIEGPRFSTRAESRLFRAWGADVVNMSVAPETALANEAGIPYAAIAMSTDYDSWKEEEEPVTWQSVLEIFEKNAENVTSVLVRTIEKIATPLTLKDKIRTVPNWPRPGVMFRDITTLLKDPEGFADIIKLLQQRYSSEKLDLIVGIESRGFIIGAALAHLLGIGFVPIRKKGKLPAETVAEEYALEYGTDKIEIHKDAVQPGQRVLLVDDLIATGGTAQAACNLLLKLGAEIAECCFVIDLPKLGGRARLQNSGQKTFCVLEFEGD